jgi:hypothetical protein
VPRPGVEVADGVDDFGMVLRDEREGEP